MPSIITDADTSRVSLALTDTPVSTDNRLLATMHAWKQALLGSNRSNPLLTLPDDATVDVGTPSELTDVCNLLVSRTKPVFLWDSGNAAFDRAVLQQPGNYMVSPTAGETLRYLYMQTGNLIESQDVNILFLACGILTWKDAPSGETFRSPLLLVPVTLERGSGGASYVIARVEQDIEVNPLLRLHLAREGIDFALPPLPEEAYLVVSAYLARVAAAAEGRDGWAVDARCLLGQFPSLHMRLYEDVTEHEGRVQSHPFVRALAGDAAALEELAVAVPSSAVDSDPDGNGLPSPFQLLDADPDQERAIRAAVRGQSFVLQGPPGTGKTQTITNIIGECLASGKSVLLVSGRVSSLESVHQRLTDRGLGDLCLTAHRLKTSKRDILQQLSQSLKPPTAAGRGAVKLSSSEHQELEGLRGELENVARELHRVREPLGMSLFDAYGIIAREEGRDPKREEWARYFAERIDAPEHLSRTDYLRQENLVAGLTTHPLWSRISEDAIWYGAFVRPLSAQGFVGLRHTLEDTLGVLYRAIHAASCLSQPCERDPPQGPRAVETLLRFVRLLLGASPYCLWILSRNDGDPTAHALLPRYREQATHLHTRLTALRSAQDTLLERYSAAILRLPPDESADDLIERLTKRQEVVLSPLLGADWQDAAVNVVVEGVLCETLDSLHATCVQLQTEVGLLASACGVFRNNVENVLAPSDSLQNLLRIATTAAGLPAFCANWLVSRDAVARRRQMYAEGKAHWELWKEQSAELLGVYEDGVLALDHADLLASLAAAPTGLNRLVNMDAMRVRRVLQGVRKPGVSVAERDMVADLEQARQASENRLWCRENVPALTESFGEFYRQGATDWDTLNGFLDAAESLCEASTPDGLLNVNTIGGVPFALVSRIAEPDDAEANDLRGQVRVVADLLAAMAQDRERLSGSVGAIPPPESSFSQIEEWCDVSRRAILEQCEVVRSVARLRLPVGKAAPAPGQDLPAVSTLAADLREAGRLQGEEAELQTEESALARDLCGPSLGGVVVNWESVIGGIAEAEGLLASFQELGETPSPALLCRLADDADRTERSALLIGRLKLEREWEAVASALSALTALFAPSYARIADRPLHEASFTGLLSWVETRLARAGESARIQTLLALRQKCVAEGLAPFFDGLASRPGETLSDRFGVPVFRAAFHRVWASGITDRVPALRDFDGTAHNRKIERFRALDRRLLECAPGKIRQAMKDPGLKQTLRSEVNLLTSRLARRRTGEVRTLLAEIPALLVALKPCVMMNPLSVRLYLDPAAITFDVVLFDDASQIATEEALGAIARGRQVIIAGDSQQLPPMPLMAESSDVRESILSTANALVAHGSGAFEGTALNWHYRSQHDSLIAFSRRYFYPDLVSFPSASRHSALEQVVLPGTDAGDVRAAVDALLAYTRREPAHSVGVVVLDETAQIHFLDEIARRQTAESGNGDSATATVAQSDETGGEPFFVKTIENVQGDERDMLLLFLPADPTRWGALNRSGARFLLNVAVTRARRHMIVATSLNAPSENASPAGVILSQFLEIVRETGQANSVPPAASHEEDTATGASDYLVESALAERNCPFHRRVGLSKCRVDFALSDPQFPHDYRLGILGDGADYVHGGTARQRDRQFPDMLRERGWNLHRIWSLDAYRNPEEQWRLLAEACDAATG